MREQYLHPDLYTVTGQAQPLVAVPGIKGFGTWSAITRAHDGTAQHGAGLTPTGSLAWLVAALDELGRNLSAEPASLARAYGR